MGVESDRVKRNVNKEEINEEFTINPDLSITAFGERDPYSNVTKIIAFADTGTDKIVVSANISAELHGGAANDDLYGGSKDDFLYGDAGDDKLFGNGGDDELYGGENADELYGGDGIDKLWGENANDVLNGGNQGDFLYGGEGQDILYGGDAGETSQDGDDFLAGGKGNDLLIGEAGNDIIDGGADIDVVAYLNSPNAVVVNIDTASGYSHKSYFLDLEPSFSIADGKAQDGYGTIDTLLNLEGILGSSFDDILIGNGQSNAIAGLAGNDLLIGNAGNDTLDGGADIDTASYRRASAAVSISLELGSASDGMGGLDTLKNIENIIGSQFADLLIGNDQANTILGGDGNDIIDGKEGSDRLFGETGNDRLLSSAGNDLLDGGADIDTVNYEKDPKGVIVNIDETKGYSNTAYPIDIEPTFSIEPGTALDGFGSTDTLRNLENITGSAYDDVLIGNSLKNTITGLDGNDLLIGNGGDDILDGGNGTDTVSYRRSVNSANIGVSVDLSTGVGFDGINGLDTLINIEDIIGSQFADRLTGSNQANTVLGGDGKDIIDGKEGNDRLFGENGKDEISGGSGDDFLVGGADADTIDGGANIDTVSYDDSPTGTIVNIDETQAYSNTAYPSDIEPTFSIASGTALDGFGSTDTLRNLENIIGSAYDDILIGSALKNILNGLNPTFRTSTFTTHTSHEYSTV